MDTPRKIGRPFVPQKLTPEVQQVIVEAVAELAPRKTAAQRAGISERTLQYWIKKGRHQTEGEYASFFAAIRKAEAQALILRITRIGKAGEGGQVVERTTTTVTKTDSHGNETTTTKTTEKVQPGQWTADAWALERRDPDNYALNRKKEIEDAVKKAVEEAFRDKPPHQPDRPARDAEASPPGE